MASPESTKPAPKSPAVQESPVFAYLSSLSPLKPVDTRPTVQPYGDTACPTPEVVFTSPRFCRPRELRSSKRLSGADKFSSATVMEPPMLQMVKLLPSGLKKCSEIGSSRDQHCGSPMTCVDAFLADPPDENYDLTGSPDHSLERAPALAQNPQIGICNSNNNQIESQSEVAVQAGHISQAATGLPDLNLIQAAPVPHAILCDSTSTNGSSIKLQVPNNRPCNSSKFVLRSSSVHGAREDPAHRGPSVDVNLAETESNLKMVNQAAEFSDASLDAQLLTVTQGHPSISNDNDAGIRREKPNNLSLRCHETISHAETFRLDESECTPQFLPEFLQDVHSGVAHLDCTGEKSSASAKVHIFCDQEDGAQYQRCMRKRLQFEAVESGGMDTEHQTDSWIFTSGISNVEPPPNSLDLKIVTAPNKDSFAVSGDKRSDQSVSRNSLCKLPCKTDSSVRNNESPVSAPRSLGIGLHLNSIVGSPNITSNSQLPEDNLGAQGEKLLSVCNNLLTQHPTDSLASRSLSHSVKSSKSSDNFSPYYAKENSVVKQQKNQAIEAPDTNYPFVYNTKPLRTSLPSKPVDHYITPCSMKKRASENSSRIESTQRSPNKKKHVKKAPDSEGCKRCNCKRSKCLKLYCDCFAAGVFCSDVCSCQGCYNKPEHEETVRETRHQIESRNPLAFAPKVVVHATNPPKDTGDMERVTPTSARHKRGCNCKKSLCLKKYCECFQAGVGCSMGCRCDGCRNTFGRKGGADEFTEADSVKYKEIVAERGPLKHLEAIEFKKGSANNEICYSRLSPPTPLFQDTNENDIARSQLPAKYYPSPESGASVSPSFESPSSPMDSISSNTFAKETEGTSALVPYNHGLGRNAAVQPDSLSPGWDGFPDICNFSPLPYPSPQASGAAGAARVREPKTFHAKLFEGTSRLSVSSLLWRSSPGTPTQQFGESKSMIEPDSHSGLHKNHADDTPEILKDTSSPIKIVKASSPNQKRVSPPNRNVLEMRSSSSPTLKSSRKYILQSVPSFPPLTPYSKRTGKNEP